MKTLWFWLRLLLDVLGALMLAGILLLLWFEFVQPALREQPTNKSTSTGPDYSLLMIQSGVTDFRDWQLSSGGADSSCHDQAGSHLLQFGHRKRGLSADLPADWQSTQQLSEIGALLLRELRKLPCARQLPAALTSTNVRPLKLRIAEASWWNGELEGWQVYLYDSSTDTMSVWVSELPP